VTREAANKPVRGKKEGGKISFDVTYLLALSWID